MSTQSITLNTVEKHSQQVREVMIYNFEQYFYHKNFRLGDGANLEELNYYRYLKDILCDDNCEIVNFLRSKLEGDLKNSPKKKKRKLSQLMQEYEHEHQIVDTRNFWTSKDW
jgi:hypothetical protein